MYLFVFENKENLLFSYRFELDSDSDLDLDQIDLIYAKLKNDTLRKEYQERKRQLDESFLAKFSAEIEKKKKLEEEQKTEANLLKKKQELTEELSDIQKKTLAVQALLRETEENLKKIKEDREDNLRKFNLERNGKIKRAALQQHEFQRKWNAQKSSSQPVIECKESDVSVSFPNSLG